MNANIDNHSASGHLLKTVQIFFCFPQKNTNGQVNHCQIAYVGFSGNQKELEGFRASSKDAAISCQILYTCTLKESNES